MDHVKVGQLHAYAAKSSKRVAEVVVSVAQYYLPCSWPIVSKHIVRYCSVGWLCKNEACDFRGPVALSLSLFLHSTNHHRLDRPEGLETRPKT